MRDGVKALTTFANTFAEATVFKESYGVQRKLRRSKGVKSLRHEGVNAMDTLRKSAGFPSAYICENFF